MPRSALALVTMTAPYSASPSSWNGTGSKRSIGALSTANPRARRLVRGGLVVGLRTGDENGHALASRRR